MPRSAVRSILVTAGPGYGKTAALRRHFPPTQHRWADRELVRRIVGGVRPEAGRGWLVVDDVPELSAAVAHSLLDWAADLPAGTGLALASRLPPTVPMSRWRGRGALDVLGPDDLALTAPQVAAVLREEHDRHDPELARRVHAVTMGWPALVRLAGQALDRRPEVGPDAVLTELARGGSPVHAYIVDEIVGTLPPAVAALLSALAPFDPVSADLCRTLRRSGFDALVASGLARPVEGAYRLVPVVAAVAAGRRSGGSRGGAIARSAAAWYAQHGQPLAAARAWRAAGDDARAADLLEREGEAMLAGGAAREFVELVAALPGRFHTPQLRLRWGDALRATGAVTEALDAFGQLAEESGAEESGADGWPSGLAWRLGLAHYLRADPRAALDAFARADKRSGRSLDDVFLLSWTTAAYWMLGDREATRAHARAALRAAGEVAEPAVGRAMASAHTAAALAAKLDGDADAVASHYAHALRYARQAGDRVQETRVLTNQAHELLARAQYAQALAAARAAVATAEQVGPAGMLLVALVNEASALDWLGRFDEATERFASALALCRHTGLRRSPLALVGLGDVHRRRGWPEQARLAYEQALAVARDSREMQTLIPALLGLARVTTDRDPRAAEALLAEAESLSPDAAAVTITAGWLHRAGGDLAAAREAAARAAELSGHQVGRLADALELRAAAGEHLTAVRAALAEARHIWDGCGAAVDSDRVVATMATLPDASTEERLAGGLAAHRLAVAGVQHAAAVVPLTLSRAAQIIDVRVLGRFEVRIGHVPVPASAWQSRKARDLLRLLVARRGRAVAREELAEALWPGEAEGRTAHRLSVALSIVRSTLDPDRRHDTDRYVIGHATGLALDPTWVRVDAEEFIEAVGYGARLYEQGDAQARSVLRAAIALYGGDAFADDPYPDWTSTLREQARAAHLRALRALARLARRGGDVDEAVARLLELLDLDQYDEAAHVDTIAVLTAAGRHGEARRARDRYAEAMRALGIAI